MKVLKCTFNKERALARRVLFSKKLSMSKLRTLKDQRFQIFSYLAGLGGCIIIA